MAVLKYKDPTTHEWTPLNTGGSSTSSTYFSARSDFPVIGEENIMYIAKDEHRTYLWNSAKLEYTLVGDGGDEEWHGI